MIQLLTVCCDIEACDRHACRYIRRCELADLVASRAPESAAVSTTTLPDERQMKALLERVMRPTE